MRGSMTASSLSSRTLIVNVHREQRRAAHDFAGGRKKRSFLGLDGPARPFFHPHLVRPTALAFLPTKQDERFQT